MNCGRNATHSNEYHDGTRQGCKYENEAKKNVRPKRRKTGKKEEEEEEEQVH